jgi:type II secretory pathway component PulF
MKSFRNDDRAEMMGILKGAILAIIALVIIVVLGTALLPGSVDTLNGVNATTHPTWTTGTLSIWSALSIFVVLVFLLIVVSILFAVLRD